MQPHDLGAADGSIAIDHLWKRKLLKLLNETPVAATLRDAVRSLPEVDQEDLDAVIDGQRDAWGEELYLPAGRFHLPRSYPLDYAVAIHIYTLEEPPVYALINRAMFNPMRRQPGAASGVSDVLRACMPFIKFLDAALAALPPAYVFQGEVRRGVKSIARKKRMDKVLALMQ